MTSIAWKNLLSDKAKFLISVGGVAFSILVILAPFGLYYGALLPSKALPLESGADIWIAQEGSGDLFHTVSLLPSGYEDELKEIDGVESVSTVINHATEVEIDGSNTTAAILGFDTDTMLGGPWNMYRGDANVRSGEIIMDRGLAAMNKLDIGDTVEIANEEFTISGISLESNVLVFQYIFMNIEDATRIFQREDAINYYLLKVEEGKIDDVRQNSSGVVPGSIVKSKEDIARSNAEVIRNSFLSVIIILAFVGLLVGITIIGITIYSSISDRVREYGVLKAIGVRNGKLYRIILEQSFISSILGFLGGVALYLIIQKGAFIFFPTVNFELPVSIYIYTAVAAVVMSLVSSFIPARKINSIDLIEVFKS